MSHTVPSPAVGGPVEGSAERPAAIREYMIVASEAIKMGNWKTHQSLQKQEDEQWSVSLFPKAGQKVAGWVPAHLPLYLQHSLQLGRVTLSDVQVTAR